MMSEKFLRVGVAALLLLGVVQAQPFSVEAVTAAYLRTQEVMWEQYKDSLPSCNADTYLSKAGAEAAVACYQVKAEEQLNQDSDITCSKECSKAISFYGIACDKEEAALEVKLATGWQELLDSNKTLPTGGDGKILEAAYAFVHAYRSAAGDSPSGFTNSGGSDFLADPENMATIKIIYDNLAEDFEQTSGYVDACMAEEVATTSHASTFQSFGMFALMLLSCVV